MLINGITTNKTLERLRYIAPSLTELVDIVHNKIRNIVVVSTFILRNIRRTLLAIR